MHPWNSAELYIWLLSECQSYYVIIVIFASRFMLLWTFIRSSMTRSRLYGLSMLQKWQSGRNKPHRHVEQEFLTLPEHMRSPPFFIGIRVARSLVFCVMFCRSLFSWLFFIFWPLYCIHLQLTDSDYPFGIDLQTYSYPRLIKQ